MLQAGENLLSSCLNTLVLGPLWLKKVDVYA